MTSRRDSNRAAAWSVVTAIEHRSAGPTHGTGTGDGSSRRAACLREIP